MNLNIESWQLFQIGRLFSIINGKGITQDEIAENPGDLIAVQSGEENNGVMGKISLSYCQKMGYSLTEKPCLTVARSGSAGFVSFQMHGCVVGDSAKILLLHESVASDEVYTFLQTILNANRFKYTYGRKVTEEKYLNDWIRLPVKRNVDGSFCKEDTLFYSNEGYVPDWKLMADFIKSIHHKPLTTKNKSGQVPSLRVNEWKEFTLSEIFKLKGGFYNKKPEHSIDGNIPFLASTETNNGVTEYYCLDDIRKWDKVGNEDDKLDNKMFDGNCIAVTVNGSVCNAFYQPDQFTCSHDITALYLRDHELTPYIGLFLCTMIMRDKYRWSYGRKPHDIKKFGKSIIKLPVDVKKKPDWRFMENYIKALPYGDRLQDIIVAED